MNLPPPPDKYDPAWMARLLQEIEDTDGRNIKRDGTLEIGGRGTRMEATDEATGQRYLLTASGGAWTLTAL